MTTELQCVCLRDTPTHPQDTEDVVSHFQVLVQPLLVSNGVLHLTNLRVVELIEPVLDSLQRQREIEV